MSKEIKVEDFPAYMAKPGDRVRDILITKTDNKGDDTGEEGYDVNVVFESGISMTDSDFWFHDLDEEPNGIYKYDGEKYIQIENWEF